MNEDKLNYRPEISYDKDYYTEGTFASTDKEINIEKPEIIVKPKDEQIIDLKEQIKDLIDMIPDEIRDAYLKPVKPMDDEYENILESEKDKDKEEDKDKPDIEIPKEPDKTLPDIINPTIPDIPEIDGNGGVKLPDEEDKDEDNEFDDIFGNGDDDTVDIPKDVPWPEFIDKQYKADYEDIYHDYLETLTTTLLDFSAEMMDITFNLKNLNPPPGTVDSLKNMDSKHLMDYCYKANIYIDQNLRLHSKMYSTEESIVHLRMVKVSKEYLKRYRGEKKLKVTSKYEIASNMLLEESIRVSELKYEENFLNLYKYLKSSVILLSNTMEMVKKQAMAIVTIAKHEGDNKT